MSSMAGSRKRRLLEDADATSDENSAHVVRSKHRPRYAEPPDLRFLCCADRMQSCEISGHWEDMVAAWSPTRLSYHSEVEIHSTNAGWYSDDLDSFHEWEELDGSGLVSRSRLKPPCRRLELMTRALTDAVVLGLRAKVYKKSEE